MSEEIDPGRASRQHRIFISAHTVALILDAEKQLGVTYGTDDEQMIAEDLFAGYALQVTLRHDASGWQLKAQATPALSAQVILLTGGSSLRQPFDKQGVVTFMIDEEALRQGFDLIVELDSSVGGGEKL